jgi:hypothetical protein
MSWASRLTFAYVIIVALLFVFLGAYALRYNNKTYNGRNLWLDVFGNGVQWAGFLLIASIVATTIITKKIRAETHLELGIA